jgi:hypothetical protein
MQRGSLYSNFHLFTRGLRLILSLYDSFSLKVDFDMFFKCMIRAHISNEFNRRFNPLESKKLNSLLIVSQQVVENTKNLPRIAAA